MSNKEWDLDNKKHLKELVHCLLIRGVEIKTDREREEYGKVYDKLVSYQKQHSLKQQLKEVIDNLPFKIGDCVITKDKTHGYTKGTVTYIDDDGEHMYLGNTCYLFDIDDFELYDEFDGLLDEDDDDETPVPKKLKVDDYVPSDEDISWDTSFERCKRLERALDATVCFFLHRMSDKEHLKQWDKLRTTLSGISCIYPKERK